MWYYGITPPNSNECPVKNSAWKMIHVPFFGRHVSFFGLHLELQEPLDGFLSIRKGLNKNQGGFAVDDMIPDIKTSKFSALLLVSSFSVKHFIGE